MDRDVLYELALEEETVPALDTEPRAPLETEMQEPLETDLDAAQRALGTGDYQALKNRPRIEGNLLEGDKSFYQLGLLDITDAEIDEIIFGGDEP